MSVLVLHHHIFKNSGSTIDSILLKNFSKSGAVFFDKDVKPGEKHYLSEAEVDEVLKKNPRAISFSSHQTHGQKFEFFGKEIIDLAMVRHPILRLKSIHSFHKKNLSMKTPMALAAQNYAFPEYVNLLLHKEPSPAAYNPQVRILGTGSVYPCPRPDRNTLDAAKSRMELMKCIGTVEKFDRTMAYAEAVLSEALPDKPIDFTYKVVNQTSDLSASTEEKLEAIRLELGVSLFEELLAANPFDVELWSFAEGLLIGRCQSINGVDERLERISRLSK